MALGRVVAWLDLTAGVAGDMLLGALIDAGAPITVVQAAVDAVLPDSVTLLTSPVTRAGMRATKLDVRLARPEQEFRTWASIRDLIESAPLDDRVKADALDVFARLAAAESRVHGIEPDDVHFHEVGAADSVADVLGVCAAVHALGISQVCASGIAVGSGQVRTEHGELPVPVPAVLELARQWTVFAGGVGELATPTGVALATTLARQCTSIPALKIRQVGMGAGTRDTAGRANVVRVVLGEPEDQPDQTEAAVVLAANVDDLDPRIWPDVLAGLIEAGASDAWLAPILMKKGRPAQTLHVLSPPERVVQLRRLIIEQTSTFGVRQTVVRRYALPRTWIPVQVADGTVRMKLAILDGRILQATPEYEDARALAELRGVPVRDVISETDAIAHSLGLVRGAPIPAT